MYGFLVKWKYSDLQVILLEPAKELNILYLQTVIVELKKLAVVLTGGGWAPVTPISVVPSFMSTAMAASMATPPPTLEAWLSACVSDKNPASLSRRIC